MSDLDELLALINTLAREKAYISVQRIKTQTEEKAWLENLLEEIEDKKIVHLVAEVDGKIMGNTNIKKYQTTVDNHVGVFGILLRKEIRGIGLSERLFRAVTAEAKKVLKLKIIKLTAFAANRRALAYYKKMGVKKLGRIKKGLKYYGRYKDEIIMVKYL